MLNSQDGEEEVGMQDYHQHVTQLERVGGGLVTNCMDVMCILLRYTHNQPCMI